MQVEIKDFTRETLSDAQSIAAKMFKLPVGNLIEHLLSNPINERVGCDSYGEIAYQDGVPVAFRAAVLKQLYLGQKPILGVVGSTFCSDKETSPVLLMKLLKKNVGARVDSKFFFTNTSCEASMKLNKLVGVKNVGPASCANIRFTILKFGSFLRIATHGKIPKFLARLVDIITMPFVAFRRLRLRKADSQIVKVDKIDASSYDRFWQSYLAKNTGLVCSRTSQELKWAFERFLEDGSVILLELHEDKCLKGYIAAKETSERRWMVYDWIALENNQAWLSSLLDGLFSYLDKVRRAALIEVIGYPEFIQPLLQAKLPYQRFATYNTVAYAFQDKSSAEEIGDALTYSWFFGAYDGDRYLN